MSVPVTVPDGDASPAWSPSPLALDRAAFRRAQRRRAALVAAVSTVVVVTTVVLVVVNAPGWERARTAFFDPANAWESLPAILEGLWLNLRVWVVAGVVGTLLGSLLPGILLLTLSTEAMQSWGWRIPLLVALPLGLIGLFIRRRLDETPFFLALREESARAANPVRATVTSSAMLPRSGVQVGSTRSSSQRDAPRVLGPLRSTPAGPGC